MAHEMYFKCAPQTEDEAGDERFVKEIELLQSTLQRERASWAEERLRAKENEDKLRDELSKVKKMFVMYDEMLREKELLKRIEEQQTNTSISCMQASQSEKDTKKEELLLEKIKQLKNVLQSEQTSRAAENMKAKENEKKLSKELRKVEKQLIVNKRCVKQCEVLEKENLELSQSLRQEKSLTADLQLEASETKKMLLHLQEDLRKLQQNHTEVTAHLECESKTNADLKVMIQHLEQKTERQGKACQTTEGQSSQNYEDNSEALHADITALQEDNSQLQRQHSSSLEEEEPKKEEVRTEVEEVRAEPASESPQVSCELSNELPAKPVQKRRKPSRWRRFVNFFACGSHQMELDGESDA
ncbi:trichohyalin-like [Trachinotus anak]|uniref:trichohyalin-like n=1 Tax=Trachinotus anak TaxID=443729 RepID=UPI0039F21CEB